MPADIGEMALERKTNIWHDEEFGRRGLAAKKHKRTQKGEIMGLSQDAIFALCDQVRETAFSLHQFLRHGHLEKVYENGMLHRLKKQGLRVETQFPLSVLDEDGTALGEYRADLMIEGILIVELKACRTLDDSHVAQLIGYLRGCRVEHGLLINFGAPRLQVKKYVLSDLPN